MFNIQSATKTFQKYAYKFYFTPHSRTDILFQVKERHVQN